MKQYTCLVLFIVLHTIIAERVKIHTYSQTGKEYSFFPLHRNYLEFNVNATSDINILLSNQYGLVPPFYEITLGAWRNTRSLIRIDQSYNYLVPYNASVITPNQFQKFWISINDTQESISVGKVNDKPFLFFQDPNYVKMSYFGITTGFGTAGDWDFDYNMLLPEN